MGMPVYLIPNPRHQSMTLSINCGKLGQEEQFKSLSHMQITTLRKSGKERRRQKKVMIPAALLLLPASSCLNRYHPGSFVKERRKYWVTGLMSLPKCLKASKWHFLSKGQGWHRLSWRVADASNQHVQMPSLKCQSLLVPGRAWRLLRFPYYLFSAVTSPIKLLGQDVAGKSRTRPVGN